MVHKGNLYPYIGHRGKILQSGATGAIAGKGHWYPANQLQCRWDGLGLPFTNWNYPLGYIASATADVSSIGLSQYVWPTYTISGINYSFKVYFQLAPDQVTVEMEWLLLRGSSLVYYLPFANTYLPNTAGLVDNSGSAGWSPLLNFPANTPSGYPVPSTKPLPWV